MCANWETLEHSVLIYFQLKPEGRGKTQFSPISWQWCINNTPGKRSGSRGINWLTQIRLHYFVWCVFGHVLMVLVFFFLFYLFGERKNVEVGKDLERDGGGERKKMCEICCITILKTKKHSHKNSKQSKIIQSTWGLWISWDFFFLILGFYDLVMLTTLCTHFLLMHPQLSSVLCTALLIPVHPSASVGFLLIVLAASLLTWEFSDHLT